MARKLQISAKCSDCCGAVLINGDKRMERQGYAPDIAGVCSGDYIDIEIDLDSGVVVGLAKYEEIEAEFPEPPEDDE